MNQIEVKVHTNGKVTPKEATKKSFDNLAAEFTALKEEFLAKVKEHKG